MGQFFDFVHDYPKNEEQIEDCFLEGLFYDDFAERLIRLVAETKYDPKSLLKTAHEADLNLLIEKAPRIRR